MAPHPAMLLLACLFSTAVAYPIDPGPSGEVEEEQMSYGSPKEIERAYHRSLKKIGEVEKAQDPENKRNVSKFCRMGSPACIYQKEGLNPAKVAAKEEGKRRLSKNPVELNEAEQSPQQALFALPASEEIGRLPAPSEALHGSADTDGADLRGQALSTAAAAGGGAGGDGAAATGARTAAGQMTAYVKSVELAEQVTQGALIQTGALPRVDKDWNTMSNKHRKYKKGRKHIWAQDPEDHSWHLATRHVEEAAVAKNNSFRHNMTDDADLVEWFEKGGGVLKYAEVEREDGDETGRPEGLVAAETIAGNKDVVIKMPLKLTLCQMTQRLVKTHRGRLSEHLNDLFKRRQDWGLAAFLLHEQHRGKDSKWYPFIKSLRMYLPRNRVLEEIEGTYAAQAMRQWNEDAQSALHALEDKPCKHDFYHLCDGMKHKHQLRWALWVVKRYAIPIYKRTTGKPVLALVPFAHLLEHRPGSGGNTTLELDNTVRVVVGKPGAAVGRGSRLGYEFGEYTDSDTFLRYHAVSRRPNPYNRIRLTLPGVKGEVDDLYWYVDHLDDWRKMLNYPPKQTELWIASQKLLLYGEEADEDEQRAVENANKMLAGLPVQVASHEERLMLAGAASDHDEAALIMSGQASEEDMQVMADGTMRPAGLPAVQLYAAAEPDEEDDQVERAMNALADGVFRLEQSVATGHTEEAVQKVINRTRDFYLKGIRPLRGLDEIDKLMSRKRILLEKCGSGKDHYFFHPVPEQEALGRVDGGDDDRDDRVGDGGAAGEVDDIHDAPDLPDEDDAGGDGLTVTDGGDTSTTTTTKSEGDNKNETEAAPPPVDPATLDGISSGLWCSVRVHLVNESDVDILCPKGEKPFHDHECRCRKLDALDKCKPEHDTMQFDPDAPISLDNERGAIRALRNSVELIRQGYRTTNEEDAANLALDTFERTSPIIAAAVRMRLREKLLLDRVLKHIEAREQALEAGEIVGQIDETRARRKEEAAKDKERAEWVDKVKAEYEKKATLVTVPVTVDGSNEPANLTLVEGASLEDTVRAFCVKHRLTVDGQKTLEKTVKARLPNGGKEGPLDLVMPVIVPAGMRQMLAVRQGENVTAAAREFCVVHNISDFSTDADDEDGGGGGGGGDQEPDDFGLVIVKKAEDKYEARMKRPVVIEVPVTAADGRSLTLQVREGEQHDLIRHVTDFSAVYRIADSMIYGLADVVFKRLPKVIVQLPVTVPGRAGLKIDVRDRDLADLDRLVGFFIEVSDLGKDSGPQLRQAILGRLHPDAVVAPAKPRN